MNIRFYTLSLVVLMSIFQTKAFAHKNVVLQYTLKNISQDLSVVEAPTRKAPGDVLDGEILNAVIRSRTAAYLVQLADDRKGRFEAEKLILDEMTPAPVEEESDPAKAKALLSEHSHSLSHVKGLFQKAEPLLFAELKKPDPNTRDFTEVKNITNDLRQDLLEIKP